VHSTRSASDKAYHLLGRWFSPGTPASSTTKAGRHDIDEILLKVALKHQKSNKKKSFLDHCIVCPSLITGNGRRGRDRMVVGFTTLPMKSVPITTDVVSSNPTQSEVHNIM
jgi:hypothetical protein